ncbi:peptidase S41 [bacterium DOLZORAL124_38_8]|nr:MAG: peptidase S41 [bacterium DOLZORAL124_38_8]
MPHYQRNIRFIWFLVLPIISFLLGWTFSQKSHQEQKNLHENLGKESVTINKLLPETTLPFSLKSKTDPKDVDLSTLWETWNTIDSTYLRQNELDTKKQIYGAIHGLVDSLGDPHTNFLTPEETEEFNSSIDGEFQGIGAEISKKDGKLVIIAPLKNSPAEQAGIKAGDEIITINEELVFDWSLLDAVLKIRGEKGTKVVLGIRRKGEKKPIDITIVRDTVTSPTVTWEMKNDHIVYVEISKFGTDLTKEFRKMLDEALLKSPKGVIIDLRNNGGGLLNTCLEVTSEFLDKALIVSTKGGTIGMNEKHFATSGGALLDIPVIVLVNKGSASASEIFAGAIADNKRGLILGENTFGKGTVQSLIELRDGSSLKVTIAEWLTPNEHSIQDNGIIPHETIEQTIEQMEQDVDPVLDRALKIFETDNEYDSLLKKYNDPKAKTVVEPLTENAENPEKEAPQPPKKDEQ